MLLVARRADRLTELAADLTARHGVRVETLAADLTDPAAPAEVMSFADQHHLAIDVLINNAGMSNSIAFADSPWPALAGELQLMVTAVTKLTHLAVPGMTPVGPRSSGMSSSSSAVVQTRRGCARSSASASIPS